MKRLTAILLSSSIAFSSVEALVNLGQGEITLDLSSSVYYDSSIQTRGNANDDFVFSAQPSLRYTRPSRNFSFSVAAGVSIVRYLDSSEFDDENFFFDVSLAPNAEREYSRFVISGNLILNSQTQSEESVGEIVTVRNYGANVEVLYDPNQNYNLIGSASFNRRDPDGGNYDEVDTTGAGLKLQVPINAQLFGEAGARYEETDSEEDRADSETYTYFVGFTGIIFTKLTGNLSVGMQQREFDNGESEDSPYFSASLGWQIDESTQASLSASRSFGTTIDSRSSETTSVNLGLSRQLRRDLTANVYVGYSEDDYSGRGVLQSRVDEEMYLGAGVTYQIVRWGSLGFDVRYTDQTSTSDAFEYDRVRAGVTFNRSW